MSGVCEKHHGYVQPGEVCPYCEPSCDLVVFAGELAQLHPAPPSPWDQAVWPLEMGHAPPTAIFAQTIAARIAAMEASRQEWSRLMCEHTRSRVNQDACADCGMSGLEVAARPRLRFTGMFTGMDPA